tara:strand:+ start:458 stop:745 length:288 start_codon:yes stop_codon:yes gene_type:complete
MKKEVQIDLTRFIGPPSLEEELSVERKILEVKEMTDIDELKIITEGLIRQHFTQTRFIAKCLERVAQLEAKIVSLQHKVKQPPATWIEKMFIRQD